MHLQVISLMVVCLASLGAVDQPQLPWIPVTLDDWPALQRSAESYCTDTRAAKRSLYPWPTQNAWGILMVPEGMSAADRIIVDIAVGTGGGTISGGQMAVWRGADGKAVGAMLYIQWQHWSKATPPLFDDEKAYCEVLAHAFAAAPPPVGKWTFDNGPEHWSATWQRPGGKAANLDDRLGKVEALRPQDARWLTDPPKPLAQAPPIAALPADAYQQRAAANPRVQRALLRAANGFPAVPLAISGVNPGSAAEAEGWKLGDVVVSIDGKPLTEPDDMRTLREPNGGINVIVLLGTDGVRKETRTKPGPLGVRLRKLPSDHGLAVLRMAGDARVAADAAVAMYACEQRDLAETAMRRLGNRLGVVATSYIKAWQASQAGDFGKCHVLLSGKAVAAEARLRAAVHDLMESNRLRSGRLLWAYPTFATRGEGAMVLRHLVASQAPGERFKLFETGLDPQIYSESASEVVRPHHQASEILLRAGTGTLTSTDQTLGVDVRLDGIPSRCRLDAEIVLRPAQLTHPGDMFESPIETYVDLGFGLTRSTEITTKGCGAVRCWLDGTIEMAEANLDDKELWHTWHTIPGGLHTDGTSNTIAVIRMGQLQRIEVNGQVVLNAFLPLVAGDSAGQEIAMLMTSHALIAPVAKFRVTMAKAVAKVSDF